MLDKLNLVLFADYGNILYSSKEIENVENTLQLTLKCLKFMNFFVQITFP